MTRHFKRQLLTIAGTIVGVALLGVTLGHGQGDAGGDEAPDIAVQGKASTSKTRAKPRGRLPIYYARVVDTEQRERIYEIQRSYAEQTEPLRRQLAELDEQLRAEMREVLSDEQRRQVDQFVAEARARREATKAKRDAARAALSESATGE